MSKSIGSFEVTTDSVIVSDPSYKANTEYNYTLNDVKPGTWQSETTESDEAEWGIRVASLIAYTGAAPNQNDFTHVTDAKIGVDMGRAGIFDSAAFSPDDPTKQWFQKEDGTLGTYEDWIDAIYNALDDDNACVMTGCTISESGFGDGIYDLFVRRESGNVTAIKIEFM